MQSKTTLINCNGDDCREELEEFSYWVGKTTQQSTYLLKSEVDSKTLTANYSEVLLKKSNAMMIANFD